MGWFRRKPRRVGFGVANAEPDTSAPPKTRPSHYEAAKPSRAWDRPQDQSETPADTKEPASDVDILHRRDSAPAIEAALDPSQIEALRQAQEKIQDLKKRSPWLGGLAEKMMNAQTLARVGTAKKHFPVPKQNRKSRFGLIIIAVVLFFLLGPIVSALALLFR